MSVLTITHTPEDGTLIDGTAKGDGTGVVLKAQRWRWSRNIGFWYIPQSRDRAPKLAQIRATATALRAAGFTVELDIDASYRTTSEVEADKIARQADRVAALDAKADRKAGDAETAWNAERAAYRARCTRCLPPRRGTCRRRSLSLTRRIRTIHSHTGGHP